MELFGYALAALIGMSIGLLGSGGSVFTIPILVYVFGLTPQMSTTYSLFVVGCASFVGLVRTVGKDLIQYKDGIYFSLSSAVVIFVVRRYCLEFIPDVFFKNEYMTVTKDNFLILLLVILMFSSVFLMIFNGKNESSFKKPLVAETHDEHPKPILFILQGVLIGLITGLVGVGGGFILIPALICIGKIPMKKAVATSFFIIFINSWIGILGDYPVLLNNFNVVFFLHFLFYVILGIFIGIKLSETVSEYHLKKIFTWVIVIVALGMLSEEINRIIN